MKLLFENWRKYLLKETKAYIQRASVPGREGPGSYHDVVITLKRGTPVSIIKTAKKWAQVKAGDHTVWIPLQGLSSTKKTSHKPIDKDKAPDVSSSPADFIAGAKG